MYRENLTIYFIRLWMFVLAICYFGNIAMAEGTKELRPLQSDHGSIQLLAANGTNATFAIINGAENQRLNVHICDSGEVVYLGFSFKNNFRFRVLDPAGKIVVLPKATNIAPGIINTYNQAVAGPSAIVGPAGYDALSFVADMTGDYYIEFEATAQITDNNVSIFDLMDVTVANNGIVRTGRLWSRAWNMTTDNLANPFNATMYVYTTDNVVTRLDFNGIQPYGFQITSNSTGTANTKNPNLDRRSNYRNNTYPEFKLFLNDPDTVCYPTGFLGEITGETSITGCPGDYCINVEVTAPGTMLFTIEANGIPGFQPNTTDRSIQSALVVGKNCVKWDGKDGKGNVLGSGASVDLSIQYINGLTNLPIYDVENHIKGYRVTYVRPKPILTGDEVTLFWDDRNITTGIALDGLNNSVNGCSLSTGCHRWSDRGTDNGCNSTCPETMNTWWYVKESSDTIAYNYFEKKIDANISTPGTGKDNDTTVCSSTRSILLKGAVSGDTISKWSVITGSGSFLEADSLRTTYTLSALDNSRPEVILRLSSVNPKCPVIHDTMKIVLEPLPVLTMPPGFSICSNNTVLTTTATIANTGGIRWGGNGGKFTDSLKTTVQYAPSQAEIESSRVKLFAYTLPGAGQLCPMIMDSVEISVYLPATLALPPDTTLCFSGQSFKLPLMAQSIASDSVVWKSIDASLSPKKGLLTELSITKSDALRVYATAHKKGCMPIKDSISIFTVTPPKIDLPDKVCFYKPLQISAMVTNPPATGSYLWMKNGTSLGLTLSSLLVNEPGEYSYSYEYKKCTVVDKVLVVSPIQLIVGDTSSCENANVLLKANAIPGATYIWQGNSTSSPFYNLNAGNGVSNFPVVSIDANGCSDTTLANITTYPIPYFSLTGEDICPGQLRSLKATLKDISLGTQYPLSLAWTKNNIPVAADIWELPYNDQGIYSLELGIKGVGCMNKQSYAVNYKPVPRISIPLNYKHCFETDPPLTLQSNPFFKYGWFSEEGLLSNSISIKVSPLEDKNYVLNVENEFGCKDSTLIKVRKVCRPRLFVPNVITPFSNDVNAGLEIFGAHYTNFEITIFSRWGEVIFNSKDPKNSWKGIYRNENMPIGNYPWLVTYEGDTEEYKGPYKKTGDVTVVR